MSAGDTNEPLKRTPLHDLHVELGARMVPFAGYAMPVQYPMGVLAEHKHTRAAAGLFDVSHMGQAWLTAPIDLAAMVERLVPGDIAALKTGRIRYTQLLTHTGGIVDDLMITRMPDRGGGEALFLVVNAGCKDNDFDLIAESLAGSADLKREDDRALLAIQGPRAAECLAHLVPDCAAMAFMSAVETTWEGAGIIVSRCGYTGEDGFEVSIEGSHAERLARALLAMEEVAPVGLGARDSLRLEAGLCLYGHDIDLTTSPVEADLAWSISKRRRQEGGFVGAEVVQRQLADGPERLRVGIVPEGRAPAREGTEVLSRDGTVIGTITSGGFGPTVDGPIAMGYVRADLAGVGTPVDLMVRGTPRPARIAAMPFVPQRYYRGSK
jgi:aminomethyltransferase